jgi:hypothetical protein
VNGHLTSGPGDGGLIVSCNAEGGQYTSFGTEDVIAENPCGVTISFEERLLSSGNCIVDGYVSQIALIWTATDVCGNHSEEQMLAQVIDTTSQYSSISNQRCRSDVMIPCRKFLLRIIVEML